MSSAGASLAASAAAAGGGRGGEAESGGALLRNQNGSVYMEDHAVSVVLIMPFGDAGNHRSPGGDGYDGFGGARSDAGVGRGRTNEAQEESVRVDGDEVTKVVERAVADAAAAVNAGDAPIVAICAIPPAGAIGETVAADVPKSCEGVEARRHRLRRFERQT